MAEEKNLKHEPTSVELLAENLAAWTELSPQERERRHREAIDYMNSEAGRKFYQRRRRHEANPFNAMFYDRESLTEELIAERVARAASFFNMEIPQMIRDSEILAQISFVIGEQHSVIRYDARRLAAIGINNADAFDSVLTHELAHRLVQGHSFNFSMNRRWSCELACDFIVGVRCSADNLASGKYKYAVAMMEASGSHPPGCFRSSAVARGYDFGKQLIEHGRCATADVALQGFTLFLYENAKELNDALLQPTRPSSPAVDLNDLPDSNLIKQYIIKHSKT